MEQVSDRAREIVATVLAFVSTNKGGYVEIKDIGAAEEVERELQAQANEILEEAAKICDALAADYGKQDEGAYRCFLLAAEEIRKKEETK